jgi:hypothetical protein
MTMESAWNGELPEKVHVQVRCHEESLTGVVIFLKPYDRNR